MGGIWVEYGWNSGGIWWNMVDDGRIWWNMLDSRWDMVNIWWKIGGIWWNMMDNRWNMVDNG